MWPRLTIPGLVVIFGLSLLLVLILALRGFLCLRLLEKRRHYVIGLSERVKECKSVNATGIPNGILSKADANPRLTEIDCISGSGQWRQYGK